MNEPVAQPSPESPWHAEHVHEMTDVRPSHVSLFALGLAATIALVLLFLTWLMGRYESAAARHDAARSSLAGDQTAPEPRLQAAPRDDLVRWRDEEHRKLTHYGWIDAKRGIVRIPVDRAIAILAERGLPAPDAPVEIVPSLKEQAP